MHDPDLAKLVAARHALEAVDGAMRIGLGTGSTADWFIRLLARQIAEGAPAVTCVPTSIASADLAARLGLTLATLEEVPWLDLTVDGADEIDPARRLIKGAGGALLREKIVAAASDRMVVIADQSKPVDTLGACPLPVEIDSFGWEATAAMVQDCLEEAEVATRRVALRRLIGPVGSAAPVVTDGGHHILDLHLSRIAAPEALSDALLRVPGVIETGLFLGMASAVIVGDADGSAAISAGDDPDEDDAWQEPERRAWPDDATPDALRQDLTEAEIPQ